MRPQPIASLIASTLAKLPGVDGVSSVAPDNTRYLFSGSGQSLYLGSVGGSGTPSVVSVDSWPNAKMVNGGSRPRVDDARVTVDSENMFADRCASLVEIDESVSSNFGETYNTGIAAKNRTIKTVIGGTGRGAQTIAALSLNTYFFTDLMIYLNRVKKRVDEAGETFAWPAHLWAQGEANVVGSTSYATYLASLQTYYEDLVEFGSAQLGGTYAPKFFTYQCGNPYVSSGVFNWGPIDALLAFGLEQSYAYCIGPWYWLTYEDSAHLVSEGYRLGGEQIGKVISRVLAGTDWKPLYWTNVSRSGTTITITYNVPVGNLVLDTTLVSDPGDYGFTYSGAGINAVSVASANTVEITIDADAGGTLGYARELTQTTANTVGKTTGCRGNLRDSDTAVTEYDGSNLYNWACHQSEVVA